MVFIQAVLRGPLVHTIWFSNTMDVIEGLFRAVMGAVVVLVAVFVLFWIVSNIKRRY